MTTTAGSGSQPGESSTPGLTFDYDRRGRMKTVVQESGSTATTTTFDWHAAGPLNSETFSGSGSFLNTLAVVSDNFDDASNILRRESLEVRKAGGAINGTPVTYSYDSAGRLGTLTSSGFSATYGYLANSELAQTVMFKAGTTPRLTSTNDFDFLNRLRSVTPLPALAGQPPLARRYNYNDANQRVYRTEGDSSYWRYAYDPEGELTSAKHYWADGSLGPGQQFEYDFDDVGNRQD